MQLNLDSTPNAIWTSHWPKSSCYQMKQPIMDIGGWLRSLGLGEYETAFREKQS